MGSQNGSDREQLSGGRHGHSRAYVARSQRERLREAMIRVAAERGYAATTVKEVVEAAGVSTATFYELFEDKESCFLEAFSAVNDVVVAHVTGAYEAAEGRPWPERVAAAMGAMVELLSAEADLARLIMVEAAGAGEQARRQYGRTLDRFAPFLEEGREYSDHEDLPPETARFAIGAGTAMIFDEIRAGRADQLGEILPDLVFAVLVPYLGPTGASAEMRRLEAAG